MQPASSIGSHARHAFETHCWPPQSESPAQSTHTKVPGAQTGAGIGMMVGGPMGMAVGAGVGAVVGLISSYFRKPEHKKIMTWGAFIRIYMGMLMVTDVFASAVWTPCTRVIAALLCCLHGDRHNAGVASIQRCLTMCDGCQPASHGLSLGMLAWSDGCN